MPTPSSDVHLVQQTERDQRLAAAGSGAGAVDAADAAGTPDTMRFRAPTLEAAIALAETSLGSRVRVVAANRIRRGGIGGFFASDLGVEVTVALDDETMEDALARLVAESEADERAQWVSSAPHAVTPSVTTSSATTQVGTGTGDAADAHALLESFAAIAARTGAIDATPSAQRHREAPNPPAVVVETDDSAPHTVNPVLAEVLAAIMEEAAHAQQLQQVHPAHAPHDEPEYTPEPESPIIARRLTAPAAPVTPFASVVPAATAGSLDAGRRPVYATPPTMMRVEQIIEELSAITAAPVFSADRGQPRVARARFGDRLETSDARAAEPIEMARPADRPKVLPTLPPRASEIARAASAASAASHARLLHAPEPRVAVEPVVRPEQPVEIVEPVEMIEMIEIEPVGDDLIEVKAAVSDVAGSLRADGTSARRLQSPARHSTTSVAATGAAAAHAPSRRHVELAVAATDQLIESLIREDGVKRLSVRVVLRTSDHREVEAEAEWEAE